jgi:hypothetical protein
MSLSLLASWSGGPSMRRGLGLVGIAALALMAAGCGGPAASVEGLVTLDGRPLAAARITFHPDSAGPVAYGVSLADGSYRLKTGAKQSGLEPGGYRVTVFAMEVVEAAEEKAGPLLTPPAYGDPAKTPLRCEVAPGPNQIPLALEAVPRLPAEKR